MNPAHVSPSPHFALGRLGVRAAIRPGQEKPMGTHKSTHGGWKKVATAVSLAARTTGCRRTGPRLAPGTFGKAELPGQCPGKERREGQPAQNHQDAQKAWIAHADQEPELDRR